MDTVDHSMHIRIRTIQETSLDTFLIRITIILPPRVMSTADKEPLYEMQEQGCS
jgi:hypothetical protein